jgi:hypothetical protein
MAARQRRTSTPFCGAVDVDPAARASYTCTLPLDGHREHEANLAAMSLPDGRCQFANVKPHCWIAEPPPTSR